MGEAAHPRAPPPLLRPARHGAQPATRPHRRCHRRRCRAPTGPRLRHQLGPRSRSRPRDRHHRGSAGRRLRWEPPPGERPHGGHDRGPHPDRRAARRRRRPGGGAPGRRHARRHGRGRMGQVRPVHPAAGDRGVHPRHRRHHRPPAGPRRARCRRPRGTDRGHHLGCRARVGRGAAVVADGPGPRSRSPHAGGRPLAPRDSRVAAGRRPRHPRGRGPGPAGRQDRRAALRPPRAQPAADTLGRSARASPAGPGCCGTGRPGEPALGDRLGCHERLRAPRPGPRAVRAGGRQPREPAVRRHPGDGRHRPHRRQRPQRRQLAPGRRDPCGVPAGRRARPQHGLSPSSPWRRWPAS